MPIPAFVDAYKLYAYGVEIGQGHRVFGKTADGKYQFHSNSNTTGVAAMLRDDKIEEHGLWEMRGRDIIPLKYSYQHSGKHKQKAIKLEFDWASWRVRNNADPVWEIEAEKGALDPMSSQIALMRDLLEGKRGDIVYRIPYKGKVQDYLLQYQGEEQLDTALGVLKTVKFRRQGSNKDRITTMWCAPALLYLPVRIEHQEPNGASMTLHLQDVQGIPKP
jgi:hypothetical protein